MHPPLRYRRLRARSDSDQGIGLVEPLVLTVMLVIVVSSTAIIFDSINRRTISTQQQVVMQASIDDDLRQIKTLARRYTCCSGVCTTATPTSVGVIGGITQPCATTNPLDDRYYFPQVDLLSTVTNEPLAVDQLCGAGNNTAFMTPFRDSVEAISLPVGATFARTTAIQPEKILRVTYTDNTSNNRVVRVENIIPQMAYFCP